MLQIALVLLLHHGDFLLVVVIHTVSALELAEASRELDVFFLTNCDNADHKYSC